MKQTAEQKRAIITNAMFRRATECGYNSMTKVRMAARAVSLYVLNGISPAKACNQAWQEFSQYG